MKGCLGELNALGKEGNEPPPVPTEQRIK